MPRTSAGVRADAVGRAHAFVTGASGWRRAGIAFAAGFLSVLAMAPFFVSPVLFLTLPVLVWLIDSAKPDEEQRASVLRSAALAGWWFGFGYFFAGLFWIGEAFLVEKEKFGWALPFAVTLMPAGLALFTAAGTVAARLFWRPGVSRVLVLAVALASAEWLRGHILTGFPWNVLGYALTSPLVLMQSAGLFGIYGLTLWTIIIFSSPAVLMADAPPGAPRRRALLVGSGIAVLPLLALCLYGAWQLSGPPSPMLDGVRVRIVQPSVPQREKWLPQNQGAIFRDHLDLSRHDASGNRDDLKGITHVVWPEAAMPFLPLEHPEALKAIGELLPEGTLLVSGAIRRESAAEPSASGASSLRPPAYNSIMVFGREGALAGLYDKIHLVPFGEYLPLQGLLESIGLEQLTHMRGGFSSGREPRPLMTIPGLPPAAGLVCYEAIFPADIVAGDGRPGLLINVTNDGWFGNTTGPRQHFHQARVRAVEEGVPLIRAANNGISAIVDATGIIYMKLDLDVRGVIDTGIPAAKPAPLYARLGDWIFLASALSVAGLAWVLQIRVIRNA